MKKLAENPELHSDIYALAAKRTALEQFGAMLTSNISESKWQRFFEKNPWIFGHGLNYVFLNQVSEKLEAVTTGHSFDRAGKRVDGLMRTRAAVSQYVLIEIKRNDTHLLKQRPYRPGCWAVSDEVSDAVSQAQKTAFEFKRNRFRDYEKDESGNDTGLSIYAIEPRGYLVIGNLDEVKSNDDKITCFELYRRNIRTPEILTFDELFERARCIVANISQEQQSDKVVSSCPSDEDVPF